MASDDFQRDLAQLLSKHGVAGLPSAATKGPMVASPGTAAASYIKEIITDSQVFDEKVLDRVVSVLKTR